MNAKLSVADLITKKLSRSPGEFLLYSCGSIEVEEDLVKTGHHEVEQRRKEKKKFKGKVFNINGKNNLKRLIQLVTALAAIQESESARVSEGKEAETSIK